MNQKDLLEKWKNEKPLYEAWASFISSKIESSLSQQITPTPLSYFLKVPAIPRLKEDSSLIDKALHRNKNYKNPYEDITDKIGIRYVVLLSSHIRQICSIIECQEFSTFWLHSKDKDFETDRESRPLEFSYQSVHYVLKSKSEINHDQITIPEGVTCEIQIRTLLQHAHSELTHDTLYKPKTNAKSSVKRTVAKSMALIEATDEFFEHAMKELELADAPQRKILEYLSKVYYQGTNTQAGKELSNQLVIDAFIDSLPENVEATIEKFLNSKSYIFDRIKERRDDRQFFKQPSVLLGYFLASTMKNTTRENWPLDFTDLETIFSDLGISNQ